MALTSKTPDTVPLCVDLDGTLICTDLLWESLKGLLAKNPLYAFVALLWWAKGRAHLKAEIGSRVSIDPHKLPYQKDFLDFLRSEKSAGRELFLVTASDARLARQVADYVGIFGELLASDGVTNLRGKTKAAALVARFGERGFDYAGNSHVDVPVWSRSHAALVVNGTAKLVERARACATVSHVFNQRKSPLLPFFQALRPKA